MALTAVRPTAPTDPPVPAARTRPGPWVLVAVGVALVVPLASVPVVALPTWAVRWALLPALAGLGLPPLVAAAARGGDVRRPARWALAWLAWAALATALAPQPVIAWWGEYRVGTGFVFLAAVAGAWALGARAGARGARPIASALLAGCVVNAAIAIASQLTDLNAFGVAPYAGRSVGLYGNPVYLAELLAGGLWIALHRVGEQRHRHWAVAAAVVIIAGIELSGSRAALGLTVGAAALAVILARRHDRALVVLAVAGGIALGAGVAALAPGSTTGTDRVTTVAVADAGIRPRVDTWRGGVWALGARPLWGWGPAGTLAAAGPRRTLALARDEGPDVMFADAHDIVVEAAVTTGVVGLALLVMWIGTAVAAVTRRRSGEGLLGFAAMVVGVSLLEPMHPGVTPLAALALGAAGAWATTGGRRRGLGASAALAVGATVATAGVVATVWLTTGLIALHQADLSGDPAAATTAARWLPPWGEPDAVVGQLLAFQSIAGRDPAKLDAAIRWWTDAAVTDRDDPSRWNDLAGALEHDGRVGDAAAAYRRALAENPWSARALAGLARIGTAGGVSATDVAAAKAKLALLKR